MKEEQFNMMMKKTIPEDISEYLSYDHLTGNLIWIKKSAYRVKLKDVAGCIDKRYGYIRVRFKGIDYLSHRIAWYLHYGTQPPKYIDHIDGNTSNNNISNIRKCTHQENMRNSKIKSNNTSGITGVLWHKVHSKWCARIKINKENIELGLFINKSDAIKARKEAEIKYFGEFRYNKAGINQLNNHKPVDKAQKKV